MDEKLGVVVMMYLLMKMLDERRENEGPKTWEEREKEERRLKRNVKIIMFVGDALVYGLTVYLVALWIWRLWR